MCFDYDPCEAYTEVYRRARKNHRCDSCGALISAGSVYLNETWIFEGEPGSSKICARCGLQRERIHEHELAEGCRQYQSWIRFGDLCDYMRESEMAWVSESQSREWGEGKYAERFAPPTKSISNQLLESGLGE